MRISLALTMTVTETLTLLSGTIGVFRGEKFEGESTWIGLEHLNLSWDESNRGPSKSNLVWIAPTTTC